MFHNVKAVQEFIRANGIRFVDFKMTDLRGRWKHLSIPAERLTEDTLVNGIGFVPTPVGGELKNEHIHKVGDCVSIGNLRTVIWRAWDVCMDI